MGPPSGFRHVFDAPVKFLARLPFDKVGRTRSADFFETQRPVLGRNGFKAVGRNEDFVRRQCNAAGISRLVESLLESVEKLLMQLA